MNIFLTIAFLFAVGSILGWCLEVLFRHFVTHKWLNPGFLIGPYLPLYGFSLSVLYLLARLEPYGAEIGVIFGDGDLYYLD